MSLVWVLGAGLVTAGAGTWAGWWYAPLLRTLNGIDPRWLGPAHTALGAAVLLLGSSGVVVSAGVRATLLISAIDAGVAVAACLAVGFRLRGHSWAPDVPPRRQYPTGGPVREQPDACDC